MLDNVTLEDFINTHDIFDEQLVITTDIPQAGGLGPCELVEFWNSIYPNLLEILKIAFDSFDKITSVYGTIEIVRKVGQTKLLKKALGKFKHFFVSKNELPDVAFDVVYTKRVWNKSDLATLLEMNEIDAERILYIFGFGYSKEDDLFIPGPNYDETRRILTENLERCREECEI